MPLGFFDHRYNPLLPRFWFGTLDARPMSLFRIVFAVLLLKDALFRLWLVPTFYADDGILPLDALHSLARQNRFSLLDALPQSWMLYLFFGAWCAVLIALALGYRTRWMVILNFICILSVHERNLWTLNGADTLFRVMSFWLLFIPLAEHYSLDALRRRWRTYVHTRQAGDLRAPARRIFAFPVRMLQIQFVLVYVFTFILKLPSDEWRDGTALHYALQVQSLMLPTGDWLFAHAPAWVLSAGTYFAIFTEALIPVFLFFPILQPRLRGIGLLMGFGLHFGIAILMAIPNFSAVMIGGYVMFLPEEWLAWLNTRLSHPAQQLYLPTPTPYSPLWFILAATPANGIALIRDLQAQSSHYDSWLVMDEAGSAYEGLSAWQQVAAHFPANRLWRWSLHFWGIRLALWWLMGRVIPAPLLPPEGYQRTPAPDYPRAKVAWRTLLTLSLAALMFVAIWWNLAGVKPNIGSDERLVGSVTGLPRQMMQFTGLHQGWGMFSPYPSKSDGWISIPAVFEDGREFDLMTGQPYSDAWNRWYVGPDQRWKKYSEVLARQRREAQLSALASYYCREYNQRADTPEGERLATLEIHYRFYRNADPDGTRSELQTRVLWRHWCYEEYRY